MNRVQKLFVILILTSLAGCAGPRVSDKRPEWVDNLHPDFPSEQYLTGHGMAKERAAAEDRARADLAKIFKVRVSEFTTDSTAFSSSSSQEEETTESRANISRNVIATTDEVISGVEISDVWLDPDTNNYYAFAMLSRQRAATSLRGEMQVLDDKTRRFIAQSQASENLFAKIAAASRAVDSQYQRAASNRYYTIVSHTGQALPTRYALGELEADLAELFARMTIRIQAVGENPRMVNELLAGAVANSGMTVSYSGQYTARAELEYELLPKTDGWFWIRGRLVFSLLDYETNSLGIKEWPLKVAGTEKATVRTRLFNKIDSLLSSELGRTIIAFAADNTE